MWFVIMDAVMIVALNRPFTITEPNGRVTSYCYSDVSNSPCSSPTPLMTEQVKVASTGEQRKTQTDFDKLYRITRTAQLDPVVPQELISSVRGLIALRRLPQTAFPENV